MAIRWFVVVFGALVSCIGVACADDIHVLTAGAFKSVVLALQPGFAAATGHHLVIANDTVGGLTKRILAGEAFDVAIITPKAIADVASAGKVASGSTADIAAVGVGVGVREGAPKPMIDTVDAFKQALLAAKSVTYTDPKSGASSGIYTDSLLDRLGIADAVRAKAKLANGGAACDAVASGEVELCVQQISEILPVKGVTLVGPLPADIQNTTVYSAGVATGSHDPAAAKALLAYIEGPQGDAVLAAKGMTRPPH